MASFAVLPCLGFLCPVIDSVTKRKRNDEVSRLAGQTTGAVEEITRDHFRRGPGLEG